MTRTEKIISLRSEIATDTERNPLPFEQFQNTCLRPILKFQNDLFLAYFASQLNGADVPTFRAQIETFVKLRLQKDLGTRNTLVGMVLSLMSEDELQYFIEHKHEMTKRIVNMLSQRIAEQLGRK